jgi:hypothetical protein
LNGTYSNSKSAWSDSICATMKSTLTVPMPPMTLRSCFAASTKPSQSWMGLSPGTRNTASSVANRPTGVKSEGSQPVSACSGVVMNEPDVVEMP